MGLFGLADGALLTCGCGSLGLGVWFFRLADRALQERRGWGAAPQGGADGPDLWRLSSRVYSWPPRGDGEP